MAILYLPTILQSKAIYGNGASVLGCTVKVFFTGSVRLYLGLSNSPTTAPTDYEEVVGLTSGVEKTFSFVTGSGSWLYYQIIKDPAAEIYVPKDARDRPIEAAITIKNFIEV